MNGKKNEVEAVEANDVIVDVETDKAVVPIQAEISGILHIIVKEGEYASLNDPIGVIYESKEEYKKNISST